MRTTSICIAVFAPLMFGLAGCDSASQQSEPVASTRLTYVSSSVQQTAGYGEDDLVLTNCTLAGPYGITALVRTTGTASWIRVQDKCPDPEFPLSHYALPVEFAENLYGKSPSPRTLRFPWEESFYVPDLTAGSHLLVSGREVDGELYIMWWVGVSLQPGDAEGAITETPEDVKVDLASDLAQLRADFAPEVIAQCTETSFNLYRDQDDFETTFFGSDPCGPTRGPNNNPEPEVTGTTNDGASSP